MSKFNQENSNLFCVHCGKQCKNLNSLTNHERLCPKNPDRVYVSYTKGKPAWNKGLTKETDARVKKCGETFSKNYHDGKFTLKNPMDNLENRVKLSQTVSSKVKSGTWHVSLAKNMHIEYHGVDLHGMWELKYAQYLDAHEIKWLRPTIKFPYTFDGKLRHYTPDFYLVDEDLYIEIKGYKTDKDEAKWSQFPNKLQVYFEKDLIELGVI